MDKLWLSPQEKKRYLQIYTKLLNHKYLQKERLQKFVVLKSQISSNSAKVIVDKSFLISKEADQIDQVGFFYLMKYVSLIQNGGSENDDITQIQKELPLPAIKDSKKSSDSSVKQEKSEKQSHRSNKSFLHSQNNSQNNEDDENRERNNQLNDQQIVDQEDNEIEDSSSVKNFSILSDPMFNSNLSNYQQSNFFMSNSAVKEQQSGLKERNQDLQNEEKEVNDKEEEKEKEEEEEESKEQFENQNKRNDLSMKEHVDIVLNIDEIQQRESAQQNDALQITQKQQDQQEQQFNKQDNQNQEGLPDFNLSKIRCMTFGQAQILQLQQEIKEDKILEQLQKDLKVEQSQSKKSDDQKQNGEDSYKAFNGRSLEVSQVNCFLNDDQQQEDKQDSIFSFKNKKDEDNQDNIQQQIEQEKQEFFGKYSKNILDNDLNNQNIQQFGDKYPTVIRNNDVYSLKNFEQAALNNRNTEDSIYELQQQQQQLSPKNDNKNPFVIKKEVSMFIASPNNIQEEENAHIESEEEEQQLIKSVSQVFQKDDQNQIKNAFDFFKSNREENQFNKSRIRKEKQQKKVKITGYRNEQENFIKKYILFLIETTYDGKKIIVERRYNDFRALHDYFENSVDYYGIIKPTLPSKNITNLGSFLGSNLMDQQTIEQRKIDLENYLILYLQNEILKNDKVLTSFLEEKQFVPPAETQFSYIGWMQKMVTNVQITDFNELKEYTEAKMKITLNEFFKLSDNEIDTKDIDQKMSVVKDLGIQVSKLINFMNDDIKYDTEQQIAVEQLEKNFYTEYDQRESTLEKQKDSLQETLKRFKSESLDLSQRVKIEIQEKVKVLQEFRIIHNAIESAKVAQQVLKNKIQERFILKKMKVSKFNKVHEQNNNKSDSSEAKRELEKLNEKFQQSEDIIKHIQDKLSKELSTFIEIQKQKIGDALQLFSEMNKLSLQKLYN